MKLTKVESKGLDKPDYDAGFNKLERFKITDKIAEDKEK